MSGYNNKRIKKSDFYCTNCGKKGLPVYRKMGQERESGHLKKMFCLFCNSEENMVEIKEQGKYKIEHFYIEYNGGNFSNGDRQMPYKQFIAKYRQEKNENIV